MSSRVPAANSILSQNGGSAPSDQSSSESSVSEEAERRPPQEQPTQAAEPRQEQAISQKRKGKLPVREDTQPEMKGYLSKAYRDLLNSAIEDARGASESDSELLRPSYIGGVFWTSDEKDAFFRALSRRGQDDLAGISRAIGTRGEVAVRAYLLLLQKSSQSPSVPVSPVDTPAAYEIGERCEKAIDVTAEALEKHALKNEIELEKEKFGDLWLIDEDLAARIEEQQQHQTDPSAPSSNPASDEEDNIPNTKPDRKDPSIHGTGPIPTESKSTDLLNPASLLQLSRSLYMNSATDPSSNWTTLTTPSTPTSGPAIFHSALNNLHTIAINLTRWLVHATLFQCFSRLRAKDAQNPAVMVTTEDVRAAVSFLELGTDWEGYWARVARRCGVEVHSDSKRYRDGRPGFKTGVALRFDEVEAELGLSRERPYVKKGEASREGEDGEDVKMENLQTSDEELEDGDVDSDAGEANDTKKRKRLMSFSDTEDEEDSHWNSRDEKASRAEERRILQMLRYSISPSPEPETPDDAEVQIAGRRKRRRVDVPHSWREDVDYMAEWEHVRLDEDSSSGNESNT